ncbi:HAD family hydrolase [Megasphaera cerevisiae]|nr:HAD family hydrolase [Megasphaera cerevisiae]SJZ86111.1 hypothetical protein SAMN05660900_01648 [Megasphaera cerevisiae DSM 20462]
MMMNKKFFFFDIDRTLGLNISERVPSDTSYCLRQLQRQNHLVAIATGRLQCDARRFAEQHHIDDIVADGGNSLTVQGQLLEMNGLPLDSCKALLHDLDKRCIPWAVVTDNTLRRYSPYENFPRADPHNYMETVIQPVPINALTVIYKITYVRQDSGQPRQEQYGLPHLPYLDNTWLIEPVDKGDGILRMLDRIGGNPDEVVVFGDGLNDISMFRKPFFSVAMGNAQPELKQLADYITDDNDKGGILHACIKFGWI